MVTLSSKLCKTMYTLGLRNVFFLMLPIQLIQLQPPFDNPDKCNQSLLILFLCWPKTLAKLRQE